MLMKDRDCTGCQYYQTAKLPDGDIAEMCAYRSLVTAWECVREVKGVSHDRQKRVSASISFREKGKADK